MNDLETQYKDFLVHKQEVLSFSGIEVSKDELNPMFFEYEKDIVKWALARGRAAVFADCGLGKTAIQLEWARIISEKKQCKVLILAPLAVANQTVREGEKFGIDVNIIRQQSDIKDGISITNYEKLDKFDVSVFDAVVLDESSILKSFMAKTREKLINAFSDTTYRLACTATPAPNDYMELANHADFLGVMDREQMLAKFFIHDGSDTTKWRLKGHAVKAFWRWLSSWAVVVDNPRNLGYEIEGFDLPDLKVSEIIVDGKLPVFDRLTLSERRKARQLTVEERCKMAAEIANEKDDQCLIWCDLNKESELCNQYCNDSMEIRGSTSEEKRLEILDDFTSGKLKVLVTKPSIAGFGMNWQNCHRMVFVGLSDSYEKYYQAMRRCWRFGQKHPVEVDIVISRLEGVVLENIKRKDNDAKKMQREMIQFTKEITKASLRGNIKLMDDYVTTKSFILPGWDEFGGDHA